MKSRATRALLFALYQLSILAGILLLPVSVAARRIGLPLPAGRLVAALGESYESLN